MISIRLANEQDAYAIAQVHVASWQKIYRGYIPDNVLDNLSVTEREMKWRELIINNVKILAAEKDNIIVGFVSFNPSRDNDTNPVICGEISAIYLNPDVWRQGIGAQLANRALDELKHAGYSEVVLWVLLENIQARRFYESLGFISTKFTKLDEFGDNVFLTEIRYFKQI